MNIFYLDHNPAKCAAYHCDKHVNKMIVEHLQMMSIALDHYGVNPARKKDGSFYKTTRYRNHPCSIWARESFDNFLYLYNLTIALCAEFRNRYGGYHAGENSVLEIDIEALHSVMPSTGLTPPAQAMPDYCKVEGDAVTAYRNYYINEKQRFAKWQYSRTPDWWQAAFE